MKTSSVRFEYSATLFAKISSCFLYLREGLQEISVTIKRHTMEVLLIKLVDLKSGSHQFMIYRH